MLRHVGHVECLPCWNRHLEALHSLSTGEPPKSCSECDTSWEELRARGEVKMVCHMENGRYRMMCLACDAIYVRKRKELYGPTEFGYRNGLN